MALFVKHQFILHMHLTDTFEFQGATESLTCSLLQGERSRCDKAEFLCSFSHTIVIMNQCTQEKMESLGSQVLCVM